MTDELDAVSLMDPIYLPVTRVELLEHFAPVGKADTVSPARLTYYEESLARLGSFRAQARIPKNRVLAETRKGLQLEKDERFWIAAALLGAFYPAEGRADRFARLLTRALDDVPPLEGFETWEEALAGELKLYFEATLPSPKPYKTWLVDNLEQRNFVPHLLELGKLAGANPEGKTWVDAILVAPDTGVGVLFEAKVLSDISTHISYDVMRNQIARNIDVMLEEHRKLTASLAARRPERSCFVLLTPGIFKENPQSRLYGWLLPEYQRNPNLLANHLPHRASEDLASVSKRLGWLTYEDCREVSPDSCAWLEGRSPAT